ncbi:MAG: PAS domain-containing protein [Alphaproteobacteria bacterium]|nr:MAG: PAS domain-containing protein [Alphaproteobacteria bacterium]
MTEDSPSISKILYQIHNGKTHIFEYFQLIFQNTPVATYWTDKNSIVQDCNSTLLKVFEKTRPQDLIGKWAFDFVFDEKDAICYINSDQNLISNDSPLLNLTEPIHSSNGECTLWCTTKMPLYDANKNINGIVGFGIPLHLGVTGFANTQLTAFHQSFKNKTNYFIYINKQIIRLTTKQAEILTHLSMGKAFKEIASAMDCSTCTVKYHIEVLKQKLNVYNTSQLIELFWNNPIKWF